MIRFPISRIRRLSISRLLLILIEAAKNQSRNNNLIQVVMDLSVAVSTTAIDNLATNELGNPIPTLAIQTSDTSIPNATDKHVQVTLLNDINPSPALLNIATDRNNEDSLNIHQSTEHPSHRFSPIIHTLGALSTHSLFTNRQSVVPISKLSLISAAISESNVKKTKMKTVTKRERLSDESESNLSGSSKKAKSDDSISKYGK